MIEFRDLQSGYAQANGTRFYYETVGSGDPLVLIHAGVADRRMWDGQLVAFAQHFKVISYDARGFGRTRIGVGGYSWSQDLRALLQALNLERVILLGSSKGGTNALDFTLEYPKVTRALVLVAAPPTGYQFKGEPPPRLLEFLPAYQQADLERAAELAVQIWLDGPRRSPDRVNPELRARVRDMMHELLAKGAMDFAEESITGTPAVDRLAEIRIPTLMVSGDQDDPSIVAADDYVASRISGATRSVIADGGHLVNFEKPEEFNRAVLSFMRVQGILPSMGEQSAA